MRDLTRKKIVCATMSCASLSLPLSDDLSDILGVAWSRISHTVLMAVIHLQFWAYGSWNSLFPISVSPTANL